jgi:hypothetical protein
MPGTVSGVKFGRIPTTRNPLAADLAGETAGKRLNRRARQVEAAHLVT